MTLVETASAFFEACETGKGWKACSTFCLADATFSCQAQALADVTTLEAYTEWMRGLLGPLAGAHYEIKGFAADPARNVVLGYAVLHATHSGEGGPVPPTGKSVEADYVYAMHFSGEKISHVTKVWNDVQSLTGLGWA